MILNGKFSRAAVGALSSLILTALFCAVFAPCSQAQERQLSPEKRAQIEAAVAKFMVLTHVPGISVAVVENGEYEWASGFGFADAENKAPASEHTLFRLASISKSLTATAAMELWSVDNSISTRLSRNTARRFLRSRRRLPRGRRWDIWPAFATINPV